MADMQPPPGLMKQHRKPTESHQHQQHVRWCNAVCVVMAVGVLAALLTLPLWHDGRSQEQSSSSSSSAAASVAGDGGYVSRNTNQITDRANGGLQHDGLQHDDVIMYRASFEIAGSGSPPGSTGGSGFSQLVYIPDLHGDLQQGMAALRLAGVMDEAGLWVGGRTLLIQGGDIVDRGPYSIDLVRLFANLTVQAHETGGRVVCLIGNHEMMLLHGDFRYFSRHELTRLGSGSASSGRDVLLKMSGTAPIGEPGEGETKEGAKGGGGFGNWLRSRPLAHISRLTAVDSHIDSDINSDGRNSDVVTDGSYVTAGVDKDVNGHGQQRRDGSDNSEAQGPASAQVLTSSGSEGLHEHERHVPGSCDMLFIHAAALPWMVEAVMMSPPPTHETFPNVNTEGDHQNTNTSSQTGLIAGEVVLGTWNQLVRHGLSSCNGRSSSCSRGQDAMTSRLLGGEGGVWSRHYTSHPEHVVCAAVEEVAKKLAVTRVVVGHTIQQGGRASIRCGGQLVMADVGMSRALGGTLGEVVVLKCGLGRESGVNGGGRLQAWLEYGHGNQRQKDVVAIPG